MKRIKLHDFKLFYEELPTRAQEIQKKTDQHLKKVANNTRNRHFHNFFNRISIILHSVSESVDQHLSRNNAHNK